VGRCGGGGGFVFETASSQRLQLHSPCTAPPYNTNTNTCTHSIHSHRITRKYNLHFTRTHAHSPGPTARATRRGRSRKTRSSPTSQSTGSGAASLRRCGSTRRRSATSASPSRALAVQSPPPRALTGQTHTPAMRSPSIRSPPTRAERPRLNHTTRQTGRAQMAAIYGGHCRTPTGVAVFPKDIYRLPRTWAAAIYNVQQWREMPRGGHFAALEQPELLAAEVIAFADLARAKRWI